MVKIRVPATSANIGPGFDTLGMALNLYGEFTFAEKPDGLQITGCDPKFQNNENLVYQSFLAGLSHLRKTAPGVSIDIRSDIPVARGLGSSSSCVIGGILGAYGLTGSPVDRNAVFSMATAIEGHPDNVSPAIFGGLTASCAIGGRAWYKKYDMDPRFHLLALIPDFEVNTADARRAMPGSYSLSDVTYSSSRLGVVLKSFEDYDKDLLRIAMDDRIHEPYRKKLIREYDEVRALCREIDSVCLFISGSGSTLINILEQEENAAVIGEKLKGLQCGWTARLLKLDTEGAKIL
ncbi:MAG: homoserine kinase [Fusobacteriaceae bacterium]|jgi:homoserine kinase|nr:homoserine kinase [Fusobacteriaceae bacterium]